MRVEVTASGPTWTIRQLQHNTGDVREILGVFQKVLDDLGMDCVALGCQTSDDIILWSDEQ